MSPFLCARCWKLRLRAMYADVFKKIEEDSMANNEKYTELCLQWIKSPSDGLALAAIDDLMDRLWKAGYITEEQMHAFFDRCENSLLHPGRVLAGMITEWTNNFSDVT